MSTLASAIGGPALAASIALTGFLSLFPLLLVGIAVMGFVAAGDTSFVSDVIEQFGLEGRAAEVVTDAIAVAEDSRRAATVIGVLGLLWSGLAVVGSLQAASNAAWQLTGRGLADKAEGLRWLTGATVLFLASLGLGALTGILPGFLAPVVLCAGLALSVALFLWTFTTLGKQAMGWRAHLPGAILAAAGFELLKVLGTVVLPRTVASSSALYGTLGVGVRGAGVARALRSADRLRGRAQRRAVRIGGRHGDRRARGPEGRR